MPRVLQGFSHPADSDRKTDVHITPKSLMKRWMMFLHGIGAEQQTQTLQPFFSTHRPLSAIQKSDHDPDEGKKVPATSGAVQDRVSLSQEAKTLANHPAPHHQGKTGTFQDSSSPLDR